MTLPNEMITGFFSAGGVRKGLVVYVTTHRIRVNKRKVQHLVKTGITIAVLGLVAPYVGMPELEPWVLILSVVVVIASRLYERRTSRRKWPTVHQVMKGPMQFEVKKGQLLRVELKAPRTLRYGYARIVPLMGEPIVLGIGSSKTFTAARQVFAGFEPSRVEMVE